MLAHNFQDVAQISNSNSILHFMIISYSLMYSYSLLLLLLAATRKNFLAVLSCLCQYQLYTNNITTWTLASNVNWTTVTHEWHTGGGGHDDDCVNYYTHQHNINHYTIPLLTVDNFANTSSPLFDDLSATCFSWFIGWSASDVIPDSSPGTLLG